MSAPRRNQPGRRARWEAGAAGRMASVRLAVVLLILANLALPFSLRAEPSACVFDYECDDCNPCMRNECVEGFCVSTAFPCPVAG